jgi:hypothetical protein
MKGYRKTTSGKIVWRYPEEVTGFMPWPTWWVSTKNVMKHTPWKNPMRKSTSWKNAYKAWIR